MSLYLVNGPDAQGQREMYAKMLEELARDVRAGKEVPIGLFAFIFNGGGAVRRFFRFSDRFNAFEAVGVFEFFKPDLLRMVGIQPHVPTPPPAVPPPSPEQPV